MIRAARLPEFEIVGDFDGPLPEAAVDAIAGLLLAAVDAEPDLHAGEEAKVRETRGGER